MQQLIVRDIEDDLVAELARRAALNGRSPEAERRAILREALAFRPPPPWFKEALVSTPDAGTDEDFDRGPRTPSS